MFYKNIQYFLFLDEPFSALPYIFWLIRPDMSFFTGFTGFRGALPAPLLTQPPAAAPTIPRRTPKKIHPWIFFGLQNRYTILHALSRHPWLFTGWQVRAKKYIHGFCQDCRIAMQFCMLLSRHPWLFTSWQARCHYRHPKTAITEYQVCHYRARPDNPLTISTISPSRIKPSLLPHSKQVVITVIPKPPLLDTKHLIIG